MSERRKELKDMNEEEKKAIEILRFSTLIRGRKPENDAVEILLNLIEKQQKEIEELKKPKFIIDVKTGTLTKIDNEFISKDKIKNLLNKYSKEHFIAKVDVEELLEEE